jgi:hypothetical protein
MMKERSQPLLSEVGENIDDMRSDVKNLSRYMVELEELAEAYRAFASNAKLSTGDDLASKTRLLKRTQKSLDYHQTQYCVDTTVRRAVAQGYDVLLASDAHTTEDSDALPAEKIIAFYNETLNGFWAGEREVRVQPASEIHFDLDPL